MSLRRWRPRGRFTPEALRDAKQFTSYFGQIGDVEKIPRKDPNKQDITMFHMTSWKNLKSIRGTDSIRTEVASLAGRAASRENAALKKHR